MEVCIAASPEQRLELSEKNIFETNRIHWVSNTGDLLQSSARFLIDCTFSGTTAPATNKPLLLHSPGNTLLQLQAAGKVARFCAWNTFLCRPVWEVAVARLTDAKWIQTEMHTMGLKILLTKDEPGFIAPRIVCNVINEAYHTLQAGVSTRQEIDLAMKLGTHYPYGPFEWCEKIGASQVKQLLQKLKDEKLYQSAIIAQE